jgi:hypothetical protein
MTKNMIRIAVGAGCGLMLSACSPQKANSPPQEQARPALLTADGIQLHLQDVTLLGLCGKIESEAGQVKVRVDRVQSSCGTKIRPNVAYPIDCLGKPCTAVELSKAMQDGLEIQAALSAAYLRGEKVEVILD